MRIAIFSDLHNLISGYQAVSLHAQRQNADRLIFLGDLGSDPDLFVALQARKIACTFGNWEVSGLRRLPQPLATWVAAWPAKIEIDDICYTHATPDIPSAITTPGEAIAYMTQGSGWNQLFPRLTTNQEARWSALAALATNQQRAAFHGHTHIQQVWVYEAGRWRTFNGPTEFTLESGTAEQPTHYLIGVGSAGAPQDGNTLRYALYDDSNKSVQLYALPRRSHRGHYR